MSQLTYSINSAEAFRGMKANAMYDFVEGGLIAQEAIGLGLGVVKGIGTDNECRLPAANQGSLVFDADFVTLNTIDMDVNGVAITQVVFATNHLTTIGLLAVELAAQANVASAVLDPADTNNRTLIITMDDGYDLSITNIVVALGASQAGGVFTAGTQDELEGLSTHTHNLVADSSGVVEYAINDPVNVTRKGIIWVYVEEAVTSDDAVYCRFLDGGAGKAVGQFRNDADSGTCFLVSDVKFKSTSTGAGIAKLEINKP